MRNTHIGLIAAAVLGIGLSVAPMASARTNVVNVTGCLSRGNEAHLYTLEDQNGTTYGLIGNRSTVNIRRHVGDEVMVTGWIAKANKQKREASENGQRPDNGYLRVNQIKTVHYSCQQQAAY